MSIPYVDAATQDSLTDAQAKYFNDKGFLVVKNMVNTHELDHLRRETLDIIQQRNVGPDYWYNDDIPGDWYNNYKQNGHDNSAKQNTSQTASTNEQQEKSDRKRGVPFRVEYVVDKLDSCKNLIAHPFLMKCIARLQGPDFLPTWDSLVFKFEGDGVPIKWHRDASAESIGGGFYNYGTPPKQGTFPPPIDRLTKYNIYLDPANTTLGNCLWAIPGSHFWDDSLASSMISHFTTNGFRTAGAVPIEVAPGDMIMHNILILHGSPSCTSPLRRTVLTLGYVRFNSFAVYYEFRTADAERTLGPHIPEYIPVKQAMLAECIKLRQGKYTEENAFQYKYSASDPPIASFRYSHDDYFSKSYKG